MRFIDGQVRLSASDVANFLACRHLTRLDLLRARGILKPPYFNDAGFDDLVKRGEAHEQTILQGFRDRDLRVIEMPPSHQNVAAGAAATAAAISSGADVIYQAVLTREAGPDGESAL